MRRAAGSHAPNIKNRSSKHLSVFTKRKPIVRCVNNAQLEKWANLNIAGAYAELKRRQEKKSSKNG